MISLIESAIKRSRTTLLILLMLVAGGMLARVAIPVASAPQVSIPFFVITLMLEGISPEDAERMLVMPAEVELRQVDGIKELTAYASEGAATLMVEFKVEEDLDQALIDLREAMNRVKPKLPSAAEEPSIVQASRGDAIIQVNVSGTDVPERVLYNIAVELQDAVESIPGILEANLQGAREELLEAIIDPLALEHYQISSESLINTITRNNRLVPAGSIDTGAGRFSVKIPSIISEAQDVFDLPVRVDGDTVVTLKDVASIRRTFKDRTNYARVNGEPTLSLAVMSTPGGNLINNVAQVRAKVDKHRASLPSNISVTFTQDQAPYAQAQITQLEGNIMTAIALVMILVVAAMGFRNGVIVGLSIPVSLLIALLVLYSIGYTFNIMVMFGMLLGLGMLIDGAIVVTEYADRKMTEGFDPRPAYLMAARRMFWPVTASIFTTLAAFLPLVLWPGVMGKFMQYLPVTVFTVLIGSLLYALVFGPVLGSIFGKAGARDERTKAILQQLEDGDPTRLKGLTGLYAKLLSLCTRYSVITIMTTVVLITGCFMAYSKFSNGVMLFSEAPGKFASITVRGNGNYSADEINELIKPVEQAILQVAGIETMNLRTMFPGAPSQEGADRIATMRIELYDESLLDRSPEAILAEIRERTNNFSGITVEIRGDKPGPSAGKPIDISLKSHDRSLLEPALLKLREQMDSIPHIVDIDDTRALPGIEWNLTVDRAQAAIFGADVSQVGVAVQLVTNGVKVGEFRPNKAIDSVDIRVRYPFENRTVNGLDALKINTPNGLVPISNFVQRNPAPRVDTMQRESGIPVEKIHAAVAAGVLADTVVKDLQRWVDNEIWPAGLEIEFQGANQDQQDSMLFIVVAMVAALVLMFVLLVTQFNSLYQATLILFAVIMSTAGVLLGLLITGSPFSVVLTGVGIVALAGIVVNNNIVLIDTYNHIKREHPELDHISLIVRTGAQRLRPVMLTTATTICGLLPLASNLSIDLANRSIVYGSQISGFWVPLSQAIVSGLTVATLLTLVATPAFLALPHQIRQFGLHIRERVSTRSVPVN